MQIKKVNFALFAGVFLAATVQAQQAVPVQVQALSTVLVEVESSAQAEVRSLNSSTLSSEVTAVVSEVLVDVGHEVHHGQRLLELDTSDYQLALAQAEANLEAGKAQKMQADARLKRARELSEKQYASADDLLARETELMTAAAQIQVQESNVALARHNLEKCHIVAPFDGAVDQRWAQVGAYVTHGSPLLSLVQTDRFELDARIPDELYARMIAARNFQSGMQFVRQLEFSLFDMRLHGAYDPDGGKTVQQVLDEVRAEVAVVMSPAFNRFQNGFSHIFAGGYAAGYYSYKWAEVLPADAYSKFEENGVFDRATGLQFLQNILEQGGSREPMELFVRFRGRIVFAVVTRYHGGAYVVFSRELNPEMKAVALSGSFASVIGGSAAAAVVFSRDVRKRAAVDPRVAQARARVERSSDPAERLARRARLEVLQAEVMLEKQAELAAEFDRIHSVERALEVGSLETLLEPSRLRPSLIEWLCERS